jgi:nitrile hydratase accessory protein
MSRQPPEPVFEEVWHGQVFALTVHLNEAGHFSWGQWAKRFGASLKRHGVDRSLNGGENYFRAWLDALEDFLTELNVVGPDDLISLKNAWKTAYLSTPHGAPVSLK